MTSEWDLHCEVLLGLGDFNGCWGTIDGFESEYRTGERNVEGRSLKECVANTWLLNQAKKN